MPTTPPKEKEISSLQNVNHSFNSNGREAEKKDEEDDDQLMPTMGKTIGAVAGAAFAAWGISKLFNTPSESSSSRSKEAMTMNSARLREPSYSNPGSYPPPPNGSKWRPPKHGWLKLNTDASIRNLNGNDTASIGGVLRDCEGVYIDGFAGRIKFSNNPEIAELKAIWAGLNWAWERLHSKIEVETDSKEAQEMILERAFKVNDPKAQLIQDCRDLLFDERWEVRLQSIGRGSNKVADRIAVLGHGLQIGEIRSYGSPPEGILHRLSNDQSW